MPLETEMDFSQAVLDEARQEAENVIELARREAERILDGARDELEQETRKESPQTATQMAKTRYNQLVAAAELEARKQELLTQEELIARVNAQVAERLAALREDAGYPALLERLILEGLDALDGESFNIVVAPEDRSLIDDAFLKALENTTTRSLALSSESAPGITGVIVQRTDGRVQCDKSLQGILQQRENEIRVVIANTLFGKK